MKSAVTMADLAATTKRLPQIAAMRKETANGLRRAHRRNPVVCRLMWRRLKDAQISMVEAFWTPPETALLRLLGANARGST